MAKTAKKKWLSRFFTRKNKTKRKHSKRKTSTQKRKNSTQKHPKRKTSTQKRKRTKAKGIACTSERRACDGAGITLTKDPCIVRTEYNIKTKCRKYHHCRLCKKRVCNDYTLTINNRDNYDKADFEDLLQQSNPKNQHHQAKLEIVAYLLDSCDVKKNIKICNDVNVVYKNLPGSVKDRLKREVPGLKKKADDETNDIMKEKKEEQDIANKKAKLREAARNTHEIWKDGQHRLAKINADREESREKFIAMRKAQLKKKEDAKRRTAEYRARTQA